MNIIFLDIDGVLNNRKWFERSTKEKKFKEWPARDVCIWNVAELNKITDATDALIVVTSTWRLGTTLNKLKELFRKTGVTGTIVGKTLKLSLMAKGVFVGDDMPRGLEIDHWINTVGKKALKIDPFKFKSYVILDDDEDILYKQRDNYIKVDGRYGLTGEDTEKIIKLLREKSHEESKNTD